jgi:hypothetical protein
MNGSLPDKTTRLRTKPLLEEIKRLQFDLNSAHAERDSYKSCLDEARRGNDKLKMIIKTINRISCGIDDA